MSLKRGRKLRKFFTAFIVCGTFLFILTAKNALALHSTSTYEKPLYGTLSADEWNNLLYDGSGNIFGDFVNTWLPARMNGPLGIATSSPNDNGVMLDVNGIVRATGFIGALSSSLTAGNITAGEFGRNFGGGDYIFGQYNPGNVGIGKIAPAVALDVIGSSNFTGTVNGSGLCINSDCRISWPSVVAAGGGNLWAGTTTGAIYNANGTNNVGIGTSAPYGKLQIGTPTGSNTNILSSYANIFGAYSATRDTLTLITTNAATQDVGSSIGFAGENSGVSPYIYSKIKGASQSGGSYTGYLAFFTTAVTSSMTERLRITGDGNVGIGTTNPQTNLEVGSSSGSNAIWINGTSPYIQLNQAGVGKAYMQWNSAGYVDMYTAGKWSFTGNVGIGVTNPVAKLDINNATNVTDVASSSADYLNIWNTSGSVGNTKFGIVFGYSAGYPRTAGIFANGNYDSNANTSLVFATRGLTGDIQERMRINYDGNVGIAKTNPAVALDVIGSGNFTGTVNGTGLCIGGDCRASWAAAGSYWTGYGSNIGNNNAGNVGIGTTAPGGKLEIKDSAASTWPLIIKSSDNQTLAGIYEEADTRPSFSIYNASEVQTFRFDTNGNSYLNGGNIGIGTTVPKGKLDVSGDNAEFWVGSSSYPATDFVLGSTRRLNYYDMMIGRNLRGVSGSDAYKTIYTGTAYGYYGMEFKNGGNIAFYATNANTVADATVTPVARLFIQGSDGNVGIGKTNPGANLDVLTSINAGSSVNGTSLCIAGDCKTAWSQVAGTNFWGGATTSDIWAGNTGNVGIGTTTPKFKLDVNGIVNASALYVNGTPYIGSQWTTQGSHIYYNTGNVGIGKTAPAVALDVIGSGNFTGTVNGTGLCIGGDCRASWPAIIAAGGGDAWSRVSPFVYMTTSTDSVGIGITNPGAKLEIVGDLKLGDTAAVCNASKTGAFRYNATSRQTYLCDGVKWKNMNNCGIITDDDGNLYGTVQIGGQCWMAENINVGTKLASGATLPNTNDNVIEKWCYNNSDANCTTYGGLYNWLEATRGSKTAGARGICPNGWHIPTDREFNDLERTTIAIIDSANSQYVCDFNTIIPGTYYWRRCADNSGTDAGGTLGAGKSLKAIGQGTSNGAGDDLVGFGLKLGGARDIDNSFQVLDSYAYIWSSTLTFDINTSNVYAWYRVFRSDYTTIDRGLDVQSYGFSVRCVKD